jgi:rod shape-determining protein MreC
MHNLILFVRRYFNFIVLFLLQGFSIYLLVRYNSYHNAFASNLMNEVTGKINARFNKVDYFFQLKKTNEVLLTTNEQLRNRLKENFEGQDTSTKMVAENLLNDTTGRQRKWLYLLAKVVSNSVSAQNNFIVLQRGSAQQLKKDAGVVDLNNGVVGIVTDVSENFTVVMSLLHKDSKMSVKLKKGGEVGQVIWDGKDPNRLSLIDIRKSGQVAKGDTVYSSGFTTTFPYGLMVGTIEDIAQDKSTNNYIIHLKSSANFYNIQYVYAIENLQREAVDQLLKNANNKANN